MLSLLQRFLTFTRKYLLTHKTHVPPLQALPSGNGCTIVFYLRQREMSSRGVTFTQQPTKQPPGAVEAIFSDPDGNTFSVNSM